MPSLTRTVFLILAGLFMAGWTYVWVRYALLRGFKALAGSLAVRATETSVADTSSGRVTVSGTAREDHGTVTAPLTDTDCLAYDVHIDRYFSGGVDGMGRGFKTIESVDDGRSFLLEDGVQSLQVDPGDARLELESKESTKGDIEAEQPDHIRRLLDEGGAHTDPEHASGRFKLEERRLHEGDETVVHGVASDESGRTQIADRPDSKSILDYALLDSFFVATEGEAPVGVGVSILLIGIGVVTTCLGLIIGMEVLSMAP
jgi:hypothetical protein